MVGIRLKKANMELGHAIVCVGHGEIEVNHSLESIENINGFKVYNSADFVNTYIYMDDNKYPFKQNIFDQFDYQGYDTKIKYFIVPLYRTHIPHVLT